MTNNISIKINFRGGIISPGDLFNILVAAGKAGITKVRFGLRQQLLMDVLPERFRQVEKQLQSLRIAFETNGEVYPNVLSSYPAEEIFITKTWLSEGVYKDIFDSMDYQPKLKINISDSNQSFTPLLTGNINWVAAPERQHFWHLFIRFPKTNVVYEWKELVYTNDISRVSKQIEKLIFASPEKYYDNPNADGNALCSLLRNEGYITRTADASAKLPLFNLPYYEGLNRYYDKYWLGIYRRDELYDVDFLKALCTLCLQTKKGQICSTPWKTVIIKSIDEKDRQLWNNLLARFRINVRHAANELNFQIEDNCLEGLKLKNYILSQFHNDDTRTFGICIGIKTRKKSEVFSSILVRRRALIDIFGIRFFHVYDILCAKDFNPNERTGTVYSSSNPKFLLGEQLRRAIFSYYSYQTEQHQQLSSLEKPKQKARSPRQVEVSFYQCKHCLSLYDERVGDSDKGIAPGVRFDRLPEAFTCALCEAPKEDFSLVKLAG